MLADGHDKTDVASAENARSASSGSSDRKLHRKDKKKSFK
jgi:hypothetical protein